MGKLYSIISALLIALWSPAAFGQTGYEWWLDNDLGGRHTGTFSGDRLDLQVDMSGMSEGLHGFNCRINRADGTWGSVYRQTVLIPTSRTKSIAQTYEYWIDDSYASKVSGSLSAGANAYTVDLQGLKEGLHRLNYRVRTQYDEWSSIYCQYFLIPEANPKTNAKAEAYEYWIDDNYGSKVSGNLSAGSNAYTVDLQGLKPGLHRLNYRVRTQYGDWSSIYCHYFCNVVESNEPRVVSYEYWLDNDRANRKTGTLDANQVTLPIDISGLDKTSDFHLFNMRVGDNISGWGSIYQQILVFNDHKGDRNIIGYRHYVNGIDLGYMEVNGGLTDSQTFTVDLPADLKLETSYSGNPTFDGDKVSVEGSDSIHYSIQARSKMGWSAPRVWDFALSQSFSTTAVSMAVNSSHDFDVPASGTFAAVKFTSPGAPLYFRADVPVALDLYRNGEKVREFTAEEIAGMASAELEAGEYFGILHDVAESEAKRFSFHLMDTPNTVPVPEITFAEGMVTITCSRSDAEIRYTLDGNDPDGESTLYAEPFEMNRNGVIKAKAFVPGSDIEPSAIAEYTVDTYKTAAPVAEFDIATRLLTLTSSTRNATIRYTFEFDESDIDGGVWTDYEDPIQIRKNCTVYSRAVFDGYRDSDITVTEITSLASSVPAPEIGFADGMVSISCANADAEIHYTVDDENLTADSPLYTEPFRLDHNATVRSFALIPGLDIEPSDIVTYVVDSFKVTTPYGDFNSGSRTLAIHCDTEGASIMYAFDMEEDWQRYTAPIAIEGNGTVYAKATRDGWNDSDIAEITISDMKCAGVTFSYDGRWLRLRTDESDAAIRYTTDGSEPSGGMEYHGMVDVKGLCTVRAVAVKNGYMNSDIAEFEIDRYADEDHAETSAEGLLESAFEWDEKGHSGEIENFRVEGRLNEADYEFLRSLRSLRHLDLEKVTDAHIPEYAFLNTGLISISLPEDLTECGDSIFSVTPRLSSVVWNSRTMDVGYGLTQGLLNPNVLLYVPAETGVSGRTDLNIVREGSDPEITLHYGFPYHAAREFRVARVSLTHDFTQTTKPDTCRGWETIVLPFSPTEIRHEVNGPTVPFAAWNEDINGDRPFWLYSATPDGWEAASSIEACLPYIISMPNNPDYVKEFNLGGKVTFSAEGVDLGPESSVADSSEWKEGMRFEGTFMPVEEAGILTLNVNSTEDGLQPGSTFVADVSPMPFGAYVSGADGRRRVPLFGESGLVGVPLIVDAGLLIETPAPGVLRICSGRECKVAVTTATGVTVRTLRLKPGEAQTLEGLTRDLYIVAGRKVMVR